MCIRDSLICVDAFTKWAEAFPLRSKEAEPIAKVLVEQVFCRFGSPVSLLSDQGKEVDGSIMKQVCRMLGIDKLRTTPYKPSTNQVERLHRSINAILGKTVASHQKDWDTRLSFAMRAYRASRHESTGYTPNMLTLGTEVRAPADIVYGSLDEPSTETYDDYVESMRQRMMTAYEEARVALRRAAERNKRYYDVRVRAKGQERPVGILLQFSQICRSLPYCRHSVTCYCAAPTKQRSQDYDGPCGQSETVLR